MSYIVIFPEEEKWCFVRVPGGTQGSHDVSVVEAEAVLFRELS
jgi:hypothetical protein